MKILVLGNAPWSNQNSVGNTLSNWFENWEDSEFAFIYNRDKKNDNCCCSNYYQITFGNIIRNICTPWKIGKEFSVVENNDLADNIFETTMINTLSSFKRRIVAFCLDQLYFSNIWLNRKMKKYIRNFNPDIVFLFTIPDAFRYNLTRYIKKNTQAKVVQYIADDVYGQSLVSNNILNIIYRNRIPKMLKLADKVYGASVPLCNAYQYNFNIKIEPLYKGCEIDYIDYFPHNPIKIIYAGNLYFGREKSLAELVKIISEINRDRLYFELYIYSNSYVSEEVRSTLDNNYGCHLCNARSYTEIKDLMRESDIVLHVESFDEEQKKSVRYSFSTKIIDCLQSGSVFMAIGPDEIASIEYSKTIPGTVVVNDLSKLKNILKNILANSNCLKEASDKIRQYAKAYHEISGVRSRMYKDFTQLL